MSTTEETSAETESSREPGFMGWVKYLWVEGLARKFIITHDGKDVVNLPLLIVLLAALVAPWLVAIGIIVAVVMGARIAVERKAGGAEATDSIADAPNPGEGDAGQA